MYCLCLPKLWLTRQEFATCDPTFYKHTQQLFLKLHECGLAYQAKSLVNWDPKDKTVLANEQVSADGLSWRSGALVEKRMLKQWFFKISEFRQELLDALNVLAEDGSWPERVLAMQRNWLGKSSGAQIKFSVMGSRGEYQDIEVFTTRPDTLLGVQYIALASTHPIVKELARKDKELQTFLDGIPNLPPDSKAGYLLPHIQATNPISQGAVAELPDAVKPPLPIYVAPYVLGDYGDGAVMGVPGHDVRDHAFWKYNCKDPVRTVIEPAVNAKAPLKQPFVLPGILTSLNGPYSGLSTDQATKVFLKILKSKRSGSPTETWRLRDWLVSRQRYWGTPIPIIHCDNCGAVPVPEDQLPVQLPDMKGNWMEGKTGNPLDHAHDWINTPCPSCNGPAKRDTDTMDTFVDSSWYFMRFIDPKNNDSLFSKDLANHLLPVDVYIGGVEHAILHLLYARFISKFLARQGLWDSQNSGEPFKRVLTQGMVHGKTYSDPVSGRFLKPDEVDLIDPKRPIVAATGQAPNISFEKMSKSKYNGVDPTTCMETYGADATRAHMLFQAPVSEVLEWDEAKISGVTRWLRRVWDLVYSQDRGREIQFTSAKQELLTREEVNRSLRFLKLPNNGPFDDVVRGLNKFHFEDKKLWGLVQKTIANVTESFSTTYSLNTVISDLMALTNAIVEHSTHDIRILRDQRMMRPSPDISLHALKTLIQMMAPVTPVFSEECWRILHPRKIPLFNMKSKGIALWQYSKEKGSFDGAPRVIKPPIRPRQFCLFLPSKVESIFTFPFPTEDGTLEMLNAERLKCAVQINGKLKFAVELPTPPDDLVGKQLETWIVEEIYRTDEGKTRLVGKNNVRDAKRIIVVKRGQTVNFVV